MGYLSFQLFSSQTRISIQAYKFFKFMYNMKIFKENRLRSMKQLIKFISNQFQTNVFHSAKILFLLTFQSLGTIIPIFTMIEPHSDFFKAYHKALLTFYTHLFATSAQIYQVFTLLHLLITLVIPIFFLIPKQILNKIALTALCLYFFASPFVLPLSAQLLFDSEFDAFDGLGILTILLGLVLCACFGVVRTSYSCRGINSALIIPCEAKNLADLLARFLLIFVPYIILSDSTLYRLSFTGLLLVLSLFEVYLLLTRYLCFRESVETATHLSCCVKSTVTLLAFILFATQSKLLLNNFLVVVCSTSIFSFLSFQRYKAYNFEEIELKEPDAIHSQQQALIFIYSNMRTFLKEGSDAYNKMQLNTTSFKFQHLPNCSNPSCFCKNSKSQQFQSQIQLLKLKQIWHKYSQSSQVSACIVYVLIQQFKKYTLTLNRLSKLKLKKDSIYAQILQVKCERQLANILAFNNKQTNTIETIKILEAEQLTQTVKQKQMALISKKADLWQKLQRGVSSPADLHKNINEQIELKRSMSELGKTTVEQHKECSQLLDMFLKYYKLIELRPKAPLWFKQALKRLYNGLQKSRISFKKGCFTDQDLTTQMYSSRACLLQSEINADCLGIIANASKNVKDIFGYDQQSIRGVQINRLMSPSMQRQHDKLLVNWIENGSWSKMGHPRTIYALRKKQVCFEVIIYLSVIQKVDCLSLAAAFFMLNDRDFMLINQEGTIDGAGTYFLESLGSKIISLPLKQICLQAEQILKIKAQKRIIHFEDKNSSERDTTALVQIREFQMGNSRHFLLQNKQTNQNDQQNKNYYNKQDQRSDQNQDIQQQKENEILINYATSSVGSTAGQVEITIQNLYNQIEMLFQNPKKTKNRELNKRRIIIILLSLIVLGIIVALIVIRVQSYSKQLILFDITLQQKNLVQKIQSLYDQTFTALLSPQYPQLKAINLKQVQIISFMLLNVFKKIASIIQDPLTAQSVKKVSNIPKLMLNSGEIIPLTAPNFLSQFVFYAKIINEAQVQNPSQNYQIKFIYQNYFNFKQFLKGITHNYINHGSDLEVTKFNLFIGLIIVYYFLSVIVVYQNSKIYIHQELNAQNIICLLGQIDKKKIFQKKIYFQQMNAEYTHNEDSVKKKQLKPSQFMHQNLQKPLNLKGISAQKMKIGKTKIFYMNLFYQFIFTLPITLIIFNQSNYTKDMDIIRQSMISFLNSQHQVMRLICELKGFAYMHPGQYFQSEKILEEQIELTSEKAYNSLKQLDAIFSETFPMSYESFIPYLYVDMCNFLSNFTDQVLGELCYKSPDYGLYKQGFTTTFNAISASLAQTVYKIKKKQKAYKQDQYQEFFLTMTGTKYISVYCSSLQQVLFQNIGKFLDTYKSNYIIYIEAFYLLSIFVRFLNLYVDLKKNKLQASNNMGRVLIIPFDIFKQNKLFMKSINQILE